RPGRRRQGRRAAARRRLARRRWRRPWRAQQRQRAGARRQGDEGRGADGHAQLRRRIVEGADPEGRAVARGGDPVLLREGAAALPASGGQGRDRLEGEPRRARRGQQDRQLVAGERERGELHVAAGEELAVPQAQRRHLQRQLPLLLQGPVARRPLSGSGTWNITLVSYDVAPMRALVAASTARRRLAAE